MSLVNQLLESVREDQLFHLDLLQDLNDGDTSIAMCKLIARIESDKQKLNY